MGITPAWAGKSCIALRRCFRCGDHPRMGGEKFFALTPCFAGCGSPPHGRGKDLLVSLETMWTRITPAWAGKSPKRDTAVAVNGDHPRVGGEKVTSTLSRIPK